MKTRAQLLKDCLSCRRLNVATILRKSYQLSLLTVRRRMQGRPVPTSKELDDIGRRYGWWAKMTDDDNGDPKWSPMPEMTHMVINGIPFIKTPGGNWAPDYSQPGVKELVKKQADEIIAEHWSIDRWRK